MRPDRHRFLAQLATVWHEHWPETLIWALTRDLSFQCVPESIPSIHVCTSVHFSLRRRHGGAGRHTGHKSDGSRGGAHHFAGQQYRIFVQKVTYIRLNTNPLPNIRSKTLHFETSSRTSAVPSRPISIASPKHIIYQTAPRPVTVTFTRAVPTTSSR